MHLACCVKIAIVRYRPQSRGQATTDGVIFKSVVFMASWIFLNLICLICILLNQASCFVLCLPHSNCLATKILSLAKDGMLILVSFGC